MCEGTGLVVYLGSWLERNCTGVVWCFCSGGVWGSGRAFWKSQVYTHTSFDESQVYTHTSCQVYAHPSL